MSEGRQALLSAGEGFPVGACAGCGRNVVAYPCAAEPVAADLASGGEAELELWACVHCDGRLGAVDWIDEAALGRLGYEVRDPLAGGCGAGCGAGGCGARARTIDDILAAYRRL